MSMSPVNMLLHSGKGTNIPRSQTTLLLQQPTKPKLMSPFQEEYTDSRERTACQIRMDTYPRVFRAHLL